ncbi:MAG: hypothetical protein MSH60_03005, partial [Ruminococcus sp.]|nr:hypothetical protein [Ruminococcus sp.]
YTKHHLNHGEEIGVKACVYGLLRREIPVINGCLILYHWKVDMIPGNYYRMLHPDIQELKKFFVLLV